MVKFISDSTEQTLNIWFFKIIYPLPNLPPRGNEQYRPSKKATPYPFFWLVGKGTGRHKF